MNIKLTISLLALALFVGCKNEPKTDSSVSNEVQENTVTVENQPSNKEMSFNGTWRNKKETEESEVILKESNKEVSGTILFKEFDGKGELYSSTGLLSIIGTVENNLLTLDIYDPKGRKASTATMVQNGKELIFKLTGQKINYPDTFSAFKVE